MASALLKSISRYLASRGWDKKRGVRRLLLACWRIMRPRRPVAVDVADGRVMLDPADRGQAPYLFLFGAYDETEAAALRAMVKPGMTVADIGANFGYFTLMLARLVGPAGRVYAFEPESAAYKLLEQTIRLNRLANVTPVQAALGDQVGRVRLFLDRRNLGNPSLSPENIPEADRAGVADVAMTTLDEYMGVRHLNAIKMDVQGAEARVLAGAERVLGRDTPAILTEYWPYGMQNLGADPQEFVARLERLGYGCALLDARSGVAKPVTALTAPLIARNRPRDKGWANMICRTHRIGSGKA